MMKREPSLQPLYSEKPIVDLTPYELTVEFYGAETPTLTFVNHRRPFVLIEALSLEWPELKDDDANRLRFKTSLTAYDDFGAEPQLAFAGTCLNACTLGDVRAFVSDVEELRRERKRRIALLTESEDFRLVCQTVGNGKGQILVATRIPSPAWEHPDVHVDAQYFETLPYLAVTEIRFLTDQSYLAAVQKAFSAILRCAGR